jgi:hypothetical protein
VAGIVHGVVLDPGGEIVFKVTDPSLGQRLLHLATTFPALSATMLKSGAAVAPHDSPLGWLAVGLIFAAFAQLIARGVAMRAELDTVI